TIPHIFENICPLSSFAVSGHSRYSIAHPPHEIEFFNSGYGGKRMCYARRTSVLAVAVGGIVWGSSALGAINASWVAPVSDSWTSPTAWTINPGYPNNGQPNPADLYNAIVNVSTGVAYTISLPSDIT